MNTANKRQIIILVALAIPVIGLMVLSFMGPQKPKPAMPPVAAKVTGNAANSKFSRKDIVLPTFQELKDNIQSRWKEAENMTPEQYANLLRTDPRLPPTLALYRERIKSRMHQLETMTKDQFEAEQRMREDNLRQQGIVPAARVPGVPATTKPLMESPAAPAGR